MTLDELKSALVDDGWKIAPSADRTGVDWYAWKRGDGLPYCLENKKPPSIVVTPYDFTWLTREGRSSINVSIAAASSTGWMSLKAYNLDLDLQAISDAVDQVSKAWIAIAKEEK